jgi:hydrogenase maturation protein HypF
MNKRILALGADIKNKFLLAEGKKLRFGPDIGDLSDAANYERFRKEIMLLARRTGRRPGIVACDLHPGYFSTRVAKDGRKWFAKNYRVIPVQHHHAHIASVMYEHGLKGPVIGVSFDGTGYGTDGNIWGGEFLIVDKNGFKRAGHLKYWMMPGGNKAVSEPWRMVLSMLGADGAVLLKKANKRDKDLVLAMMSKNINSPLTSSAGRLFDAASALLGICEYASYEAEGPVKLESMCADRVKGSYGFKISKGKDCCIIDTKGILQGMLKDIKKGKDKGTIATKFHNSMSKVIVRTVKKLSERFNITDIALSGGVFQNRFLTERTMQALERSGFRVFINRSAPAGDLNIALGQYYVFSNSCGN